MLGNKDFIKFFVFIFNIVYVLSECEISKEAADNCGMKSVFFGNRETSVPLNDAELDTFCSQLRTNTKCIENFNNKCLKGRVQLAISIAINNGKKFIDKRCNAGKDRQDFMTHIKCLHPNEKMEPFHMCADKNLVMLTKLKDIPKPDRVAALCCIAHVSQECMQKQFKQHCGEETTNYWDDAWDELTAENMEFACSDFPSVAKCDASLNPDAWSAIKAVAATDDASILAQRHAFKSEITTAIELMEFLE